MDKYQETFKTWNKIAQLYEDKFLHLDIYNNSYDVLIDKLDKQKAAILDVACGPGNITNYLLSRQPNWQIKGIDIAENMITLAKRNNPSAEFEILDCREINSLQDRFDAIVCGFGLPYLSPSNCLDFLKNCHHLLHPRGILYLSFVEGQQEESGFISGASGDRTYFYYHPLDFIQQALKDNAFEIINLLYQTYTKSAAEEETHTIVLAQKIKAQ